MMTSLVVNTYTDSSYGYDFKEPKMEREIIDHFVRREVKYQREGMRRSVGGILMVHENKHLHVLLLTIANTFYQLPGGRLKPGENEIEGLKRKLSSKLGGTSPSLQLDWQIGQCVGMWWYPDFGTDVHPYCPHDIEPKECKKLFIVHLPERGSFRIPSNYDLLGVPLSNLYNHPTSFGPILSSIPQQLSRFQFNCIDT